MPDGPNFTVPPTLRSAETMYYPECLPPMLDFLDRIGMPFKAGPFGQDGFLPGIQIVNGEMLIDPDRLAGSGDVLHEAGHIVIVPSRWRSELGNDVIESLDAVVATDPDAADDFQLQTSIKMSEFMAQAWSYAALKDLGLPPECVFFPGSYKYHPDMKPHPMATWVESGTHFGIMALSQVGMTGGLGLFEPPGANGLEPFPKMAKWLQD
jgi:hypothetical protein